MYLPLLCNVERIRHIVRYMSTVNYLLEPDHNLPPQICENSA